MSKSKYNLLRPGARGINGIVEKCARKCRRLFYLYSQWYFYGAVRGQRDGARVRTRIDISRSRFISP